MSEPREFEYVLERQSDGGFLIYVPELPGLATEGDTREEAIAMLRDALPAYLESMRAHDLPLPQARHSRRRVSPRLPAVRPRQLIRVLERKGWRLDRTSGSHQVFVHDVVRHVVVVPMHNKDLGRGLLARILQDAEIPRDEFLKLL